MNKKRENFFLIILAMLVVILIGLFFLQAKSEERNIEKKLVKVMVSKIDIPIDEPIIDFPLNPEKIQKNIEVIQIDRKDLKDEYLDEEKWNAILTEKKPLFAKTAIYKNDLLTTSHTTIKELSADERFELTIDDKKVISTSIQNDSIVQLIVVPTGFAQPFVIADSKKVIQTKTRKSSTGEEETTSITISISEKELQNYLASKELGTIKVVSYSDFSDSELKQMYSFEDAQHSILNNQRFNTENKIKNTVKTVIYKVEADSLVDSILKENQLSLEHFLFLNKHLSNITEHSILLENEWIRTN